MSVSPDPYIGLAASWAFRFVAILAMLAAACPVIALAGEAGDARIPSLAWTPRSDWLSVADHGAIGDGKADDSAAIQKAFDAVRNGSTVYFPPGAYRLTKSVRITGPLIGVTLIGHGRDTSLVWDGPAGGSVLVDDGLAESRFVGLSFEGRSRAAIGFHHDSHRRFETEVLHHHLAFRDFTDAGILAEPKDKYALAETEFRNCLFVNCRRGVAFVSFNDYDFTFDGCLFDRCQTAIQCVHGNFYARNCRFQASGDVDIHAAGEHSCSIRRCVSVGSRAFLRHTASVAPITIQDCCVSDWTGPEAVLLGGAPALMFDCSFRGHQTDQPPVRIARAGQRLVASANQVQGPAELIQPGHKGRVYNVPPSKHAGRLTSPDMRFLADSAAVPTRVFDARRDFGAAGNGRTDDTAAIQKAIDAARAHGRGAIAYLPTGSYAIAATLRLAGGPYRVGGTGFMTRLVWRGPAGGTMVHVHDPNDITLEHMAVGNHDAGKMDNDIDILQTGSSAPSRMTYDGMFVYGMYQRQPFRKGLHLRGLGERAVVVMPHVQGNLRFIDSARATILANCSYEGSVVVEGSDARRGGFLGFMTRLSTITTHGLYLKDNHSIVMSDFYVEQADNGFVLEGGPADPPGRATIQGAKVDFTHNDKARDGTVLDIRGYAGQVFLGPDQFYASLPRVPVLYQGTRPLDLFLWSNCFYKTHLEAAKAPTLRLYLLANEGVAVEGKDRILTHEDRAEDNLPPDQYNRLNSALDDLRRLGALDLRLNHPQPAVPKGGAAP